jgi:Fe-S-cluster-containing dehydrogenase component
MKMLVAFGMSTAGAAAITVPFTQKQIAEAAGGEESDRRWTMIIDLEKCIGCEYCIKACQAVNNVPDDMRWNVYLPEKTQTGETFHMTKPCLHCQDAPCADVCPTKATYQRGDGLVIMDYDRCIGCRYCMVACPYEVRTFNWDPVDRDALAAPHLQPEWGSPEVERRPRGVVEKCTFCVHRIDRGLANGLIPGEDPSATPACCNICPVDARVFGDRNDPNSRVAEIIRTTPTFRLQEELGTEPNVYYVPAEGMVPQS